MVPVSRVIPSVLADVIRKAPLCQEKVDFAWGETVGPALKRVTSVHLDGAGVLHVRADGEWGRELRRRSPMILQRLERLLGRDTVTGMSFSQAP